MPAALLVGGLAMLGVAAVVYARTRSKQPERSVERRGGQAPHPMNSWAALVLMLAGLALVGGGLVAARSNSSDSASLLDRTSASETPSLDEAERTAQASPTTVDTTSTSKSASAQSDPEPPTVSDTNAYRLTVIEVSDQIGAQLDQLTTQLVTARYNDRAWIEQTESVLALMRLSAKDARALQPPDEFETAHDVWMAGIDAYEWVAENMAVAIHGPDEELLRTCNERLRAASASFERATALMSQVATP